MQITHKDDWTYEYINGVNKTFSQVKESLKVCVPKSQWKGACCDRPSRCPTGVRLAAGARSRSHSRRKWTARVHSVRLSDRSVSQAAGRVLGQFATAVRLERCAQLCAAHYSRVFLQGKLYFRSAENLYNILIMICYRHRMSVPWSCRRHCGKSSRRPDRRSDKRCRWTCTRARISWDSLSRTTMRNSWSESLCNTLRRCRVPVSIDSSCQTKFVYPPKVEVKKYIKIVLDHDKYIYIVFSI